MKTYEVLVVVALDEPFKQRNAEGEFIGLIWKYGRIFWLNALTFEDAAGIVCSAVEDGTVAEVAGKELDSESLTDILRESYKTGLGIWHVSGRMLIPEGEPTENLFGQAGG